MIERNNGRFMVKKLTIFGILLQSDLALKTDAIGLSGSHCWLVSLTVLSHDRASSFRKYLRKMTCSGQVSLDSAMSILASGITKWNDLTFCLILGSSRQAIGSISFCWQYSRRDSRNIRGHPANEVVSSWSPTRFKFNYSK